MTTPHLSSRRWFWIFTGILLAWALISSHFFAASANADQKQPLGMRIEAPFRMAVTTTLTPPGELLNELQSGWLHLISKSSTTQPHEQDYQKLVEENERLKQEAFIRLNEIDTLQATILNARIITERFPTLTLLAANISGLGAGVSNDYCTLDKGYANNNGVQRGSPVFLQYALLGRVKDVGTANCSVQLLTDKGMKVVSSIVRMTPQGPMDIGGVCLVYGNGNNSLRCEAGDIHTQEPKMGDLLLLNDKDWPTTVQHVLIGKVVEVRQNETNSVRRELVIEPAVTVHSNGQVSIVLMSR